MSAGRPFRRSVARGRILFVSTPIRDDASPREKEGVVRRRLVATTGHCPCGAVLEVPEDLEQFVSRDSRSRFIAYIPTGSIQKGKALASTGDGGRTVQCAICHGPDLRGLGPIPGIAGRSPSYLVRQLYDFQHGTRAGIGSALMKPTVAKLTLEDMVALAAYAASLEP